MYYTWSQQGPIHFNFLKLICPSGNVLCIQHCIQLWCPYKFKNICGISWNKNMYLTTGL